MPAVILKKKPLYFSCKKKLWNGTAEWEKDIGIMMRNRIYWNNSNNNMQKGIALATCMAIVMGLLTGCGKKNDLQIAASPDEVQKGRYVETELSLPEEWKDKNISQIFRSGDELHFLVAGGPEGQVSLEEWKLGEGDTLTEVTKDWLKALPEGKGLESSDSFTLLQDTEGNQYLYGNCYRDEESSSAHLWKETDGSALDITPQKWLEPMDMDGYRFYDTPQYVALTEDGLLVGLSYFSLDVVLAQDGSLVSSQESDSLTDSGSLSDNQWVSAVGDTLYLAQADEQGSVNGLLQMQLDGNNGAKAKGVIPFSQDSYSSAYFSVLGDGTVYAADADGFFRCDAGDTNWQKLLEGIDTSFSMSDQWCRDIVALSDGSVYAWFGSESGDKIMIYRYDPDAVTEVTEELTLYTVEESFFLQQAAVQYHKQHPEVLIHVDAAISMTDKYSGNADYQQIYQDLNTSLTSGNGPDLMVMDHLKLDTYASKGLLLNLQEILQPMEEDGSLLSNITKAYEETDGARYAVPLQFGLLLAVGRDVQPEEMSSMDAIAKAVSRKTESYMGDRTCGELVEEFYPLIVDDILQNRQVNRDTLRPWLEDLKKIADNCGILPSRKEGRAANIWDLGSDVKLVFQETDGFNEAMMPYAVAELLNANVVSMENAFYPKMVIGINSRSEHVETAKDFLRFALSEELQSVDTYEGFPVNAKALEAQAAADRSMAEAYTTYDIDGSTAEFAIKAYSEETANHLMELCKAATLCLKEDTQIETSLTESLQAYLNGQASVEEAMDAVEGSLKMYLAE